MKISRKALSPTDREHLRLFEDLYGFQFEDEVVKIKSRGGGYLYHIFGKDLSGIGIASMKSPGGHFTLYYESGGPYKLFKGFSDYQENNKDNEWNVEMAKFRARRDEELRELGVDTKGLSLGAMEQLEELVQDLEEE